MVFSFVLYIALHAFTLFQQSKGFEAHDVTNITMNSIWKLAVHDYIPMHICHEYPQIESNHTLSSILFHDRVFEIVGEQSDGPFPWHSIRAVSQDDAHTHIQDVLFTIFNEKNVMKTKVSTHEMRRFVRDWFFSCPSPFLAGNQRKCIMRFSVLQQACVTMKFPETRNITVITSEAFNTQYVYNLITGLGLLIFAADLAGSDFFQYTSGASLFALFGLVIILMYLFQRITDSKSLSVNTMFLTTILTGYSTSIVYYIRSNAKQLFLNNWEICLGYLVTACALGLLVTRYARSNETIKYSITSLVTLFLRFVGLIFVYYSFASSLVSLLAIASLIVFYIGSSVMQIFTGLFGSSSGPRVKKRRNRDSNITEDDYYQ